MQKINDFENVEASSRESNRLLPGGYVCVITRVEDVADKKYLRIEYDICEGESKGYASDCMERNGWWNLKFVKSYKDTAARFFKAFINSVEQSNKNFVWDWDEHSLEGKIVGCVLGLEEFQKQDGNIGNRLYVDYTCSVDSIRNKQYQPAKAKKLADKKPSTPAFVQAETNNAEGDLPF